MIIRNEFILGWSHFFLSPVYIIRSGLEKLVKKLAPRLKGRLLDYGCGSRPYESLFHVDEYIGLDIEVSGHEHANKKADVYFDGSIIPFPDNYFDSVFASEVFEHVFELRTTLLEIHRVTKAGGKLLLTAPFVFPEHEAPYDYARYTRFALRKELEIAGFLIVEEHKAGCWWEVLCQMGCLYFRRHYGFHGIPIVRGIFRRFWCTFFNSMAVCGRVILVRDMELHLSHGILAQKS